MKTFKQHVKEGYKQGKYGAGTVGVETSDAVEDSVIGTHNIQDPDVLKRVNAFVGSIAEQEYIKPQFAVDKLREKLLKNNIQTGIHYIPGYLLDYYKKNKRLFPNCEKVHKKVLTLPLHPDISPKNINFITKKILNYLEK